MRALIGTMFVIAMATSLAAQPTLDWSDGYSPGHWAHAHNVATDAAGNVYVYGGHAATAGGDSEVFLRKYSPSGSTLWTQTHTTGQGGTSPGWRGLAVDAAGNSLITGSTWVFPGGGGPPTVYAFARRYDTSGALTLNLAVSEEVDVCIFGPGGEIYIGAYDNVYAYDSSGTQLWANSFPTSGEGVSQLLLRGATLYASNSTTAGQAVRAINVATGVTIWTTALAGNLGWISNLANDAAGNIYVSGTYSDPNPPNDLGVMLARLSPSGVQDWIEHRLAGGGYALVVSDAGDTYVGGGGAVQRFSSAGTFQWEFAYTSGSWGFNDIELDQGLLYFAGRYYDGATVGQARVGALDLSGTEQWHVDFTTTTPGEFYALAVAGNRLVAAGEEWDSSTGVGEMIVAQYTLPAAPTPELEVRRTGPGVIADGGNDAISGSIVGIPVDLTYTLENSGNATLTFGAPGMSSSITQGSANWMITGAPVDNSTLISGGDLDVDVSITPDATGPWTVTITINSDGSAGGSHVFTISGNAAAPDLQVQRTHAGGTSTLADGDTDTVFGTVDAVMTTLTYDLTNIGNALLTFGATSVTITPGTASPTVALVGTPAGSSTLAVSGTTDFDVQITPSSDGAWTATLEIHSDGTAGGTHTITISGTAQATASPLITVLRGSSTITDGGSDSLTANTVNVTYTIRNEGSEILNLTAVPIVAAANESNCTVAITQPTSSTVAAGGGTVTFTVQVTALSTGAFSFDLAIAHDAVGALYAFTVNGSTTASPPPGDDGKEKDSGCSTTSDTSPLLLILAAMLAATALARRSKEMA